MGGGVWIKGRCVCPCFGVFEAPSRLPISLTVIVLSDGPSFLFLFSYSLFRVWEVFLECFYLFSVWRVLGVLFRSLVMCCLVLLFWCFYEVLGRVGGVRVVAVVVVVFVFCVMVVVLLRLLCCVLFLGVA